MPQTSFTIEERGAISIVQFTSSDDTNRLTRECVTSLTEALHDLASHPCGLIITGNDRFFSAGAELNEVMVLTPAMAYEFAIKGQALMDAVQQFPAPVYAAISGYCMGGGLDLALACHRRIAAPSAVFGHRGTALGLITGWGGTHRLPQLVGKGPAFEMFLTAEKLHAARALKMGLVDAVAHDPIGASISRMSSW